MVHEEVGELPNEGKLLSRSSCGIGQEELSQLVLGWGWVGGAGLGWNVCVVTAFALD